ncbi:MAG: sigma-70 family RNA polymerase sigma factor [Planctomycetota bacterium]
MDDPAQNPTEPRQAVEYDELAERALAGDETALAEAFERDRARLRRMILLRLDARLERRVDASDILQESFIELSRQLPEFAESRHLPFFLWMRFVTGNRIAKAHRQHLDAKMRDARMEVSMNGGKVPQATSLALASQLLGRITSPSERAIKAEARAQLQIALNDMDPIDREILSLRHLEDLTNKEAALELGLDKSAATKRYMRALRRLRETMNRIPGLMDSES